MDDAEIAGPVLARDKAYTAVAHRCPTADLRAEVGERGDLTGMFAADGGRFVCFGGGHPLWSQDRVVGGVGVSGGTAAQDVACAAAAVAVWDVQEARESQDADDVQTARSADLAPGAGHAHDPHEGVTR